MKRILLFSAILLIANVVLAQSDCMNFYPDTEGTVLETTTYDASKRPLRTMIYRVNGYNQNVAGYGVEVGFTMMNNNQVVLNSGTINAGCDNGNFRMRMDTRALTPEVMDIFSTSTELVGSFLDFPNIFNNDMNPFANPLEMTGGEFNIQSSNDNNEDIRVRVYNRQYEGNESIFVPARRDSFNASKITFSFEVTKDGTTRQFRGEEWYSNNFGIIRSETYDNNNNLVNTTLLTSIRER